jgi:two-component system, chemotaxis family, response regulator PixG
MMTDQTAMTKLSYDLLMLSQQRATGELTVNYGTEPLQCRLYFYLGRLVYATGGVHPVRRWNRGLQQHCPNCITSQWIKVARSSHTSSHELWEIDLLNQAMAQNLIGLNEAKAAIRQITQEVLFEILGYGKATTSWKPGVKVEHQTTFLAIEQLINEAQALRLQWYAIGRGAQAFFAQVSPDLAPVVIHPYELESQVSPEAFISMVNLMKGQYTLWDVAGQMKCSLPNLIRVLWKLIQQGVIELRPIPDLPAPIAQPAPTPKAVVKPKKKFLIACIDDSPAIGQKMNQILEPEGYEVLTITNPLQGISILLDRKPDLIFLDLVMPNTNGYELCTFLRKTSAFQNTPIVILTGHDGVIDRVRAKLAGSSDFLAKPPEADKVLQVVDRFLEPQSSSAMNNFVTSMA